MQADAGAAKRFAVGDGFHQRLAGMALPPAATATLAEFVLEIGAQADCRDLPALLLSSGPEAAVFS